MKITVAWIGKSKEPAIQALTGEYLKRLSRYAQVEGVAFKDESSLLALANPKSQTKARLVVLDSRGKQFSSEELAKFLESHQQSSSQPLLFAVGPADGFSEEARKAAAATLSFGKMTLSHELARVVLLEQLYRAFTILKGHPYHLGHR